MARGFGVGDLDGLTNRLRRASEDLDDAAVRIAGLGVGRHGVLDPTTARAVHVVWSGWSGRAAELAARCIRLAGALSEVSRRYRATDVGVAGCPDFGGASRFTAAGEVGAVSATVSLTEGPLLADPGEAFANMVAACHHLSIDIDNVAHTITASPAAVEWWGAAADAAYAAIRDLSGDVAAIAAAIDALRDVFAAYGDTVWPRAGLPLSALAVLRSVDPGGDLAEEARDANIRLRAGLAAWTPPGHGVTATVGDQLPHHSRRPVQTLRHVAVLTAESVGRIVTATQTGSPMVARRAPIDTYRVTPGDTLWAIARRTLGDARRWRDIFALNEGRRQRDGRTLTDPRLIMPGWRLQLPHTESHLGPTAVAHPGRAGGNPPTAAPTTTRPTPATAVPNITPTTSPRGHAAQPARGHGSMWPIVDVGLGAALGAGVGWVAGRCRPRPGMATRSAGRPTTTTPAESDPPTERIGRGGPPPTDPAASPPPNAPTPRRDIAPRAPARSAITDIVGRWPDDWTPVGTGLVGPGAAAAARTLLLDALQTHPPSGAARAGTVIATSSAITALLRPEDPTVADNVPRLTILDDLTAALDRLDQEILTRSRTTNHDATPAQDSDPDAGNGPSPPLLVIVEPPPTAERVRLAAILLQGTTLGIDAVILGPWPSGDTITVDHDRHSTPADDSGPDAARQSPLTDVDAARTLLRSLASARPCETDDPPHPATPDPQPTHAPVSSPPRMAADAASLTADPLATPTAPPNRAVTTEVDSVSKRPAGQLTGGGHPTRSRVDVRVLGAAPHLTNPPSDTTAPPPWRPQARELLAYLICHPRGIAENILFEDVLGDVPGSKVRSRLNTYVYNLHQQLRAAGGPGTYITHTPRGHIMIDPDRVDCDLWRLHQHLHNATTATDTGTRITELRTAVAAYRGPLAADHDYYWIPPIREATRRQAIDAHLALADLLADTDPATAAVVIEQAIAHDPYNETLYQQAMRLHAAQHAFPAIAVLRNRLVRELADIGTAPSPDTIQLADNLLAHPAPPSR